MKHIFVTVGTTKFTKLVDTITTLNTVKTLQELGYTSVQIQTGRDFDEVKIDSKIRNATVGKKENTWVVDLIDFNITIKYDPYFETFEEQIKKADLVISHAGAGSCLDVLRLKKPLIVVINEDLMDNHQTELANQLQKYGYLYSCNCNSLEETLHKNSNLLIPYPEPNKDLFSTYLDKCCGFVQ